MWLWSMKKIGSIILEEERIHKRNDWQKALMCLFLCGFVSLSTFSQTKEQLYKAANESLKNGEYHLAATYFKQALDKEDAQAEIWYGYAEASRLFNDYQNAANAYQKVLELDKKREFPLCNFWLGSMLINQEQYEDAKKHLSAFQNRYRKKDFYAQKVQQLIESSAWAMANDSVQMIEVQPLPDSINSTFSELNPFVAYDGALFYSSTKPAKGKSFRTQMIEAKSGETFLPGISNTSAKHVANGFFSNNVTYGKEVFFTQCNTESGITRCRIFVSQWKDGKWNTAKELPAGINLIGYTATHPNILNEANGTQWLFFASNRPGTKGKMDIWFSKRLSAAEWDYPRNAGDNINSIDDEITPFADAQSMQLYFSSTWHYGYGSFDVFSSSIRSLENADFSKPKNLGKPINSGANEVYYITYDSVALFSSNRIGSKFIEAATCCNDIYMAQKERKKQEEQQQEIVEQEQVIELPDEEKETAKHAAPIFTHEEITLYFHNDEPNPKTFSDTTDWTYLEAYNSYMRLQNEYEKNYALNLVGAERAEAENAIQSWFKNSVEANFLKLESFTAQIKSMLCNGNKVHIEISGYCSPLNYSEYNLKLGNRRAVSILNYLTHYQNDTLQSFIANRNLEILIVSKGEETATSNVSDDLQDLRNSVYSPAAAGERRVTVSISVKK